VDQDFNQPILAVRLCLPERLEYFLMELILKVGILEVTDSLYGFFQPLKIRDFLTDKIEVQINNDQYNIDEGGLE
jgi:hypothetical protein